MFAVTATWSLLAYLWLFICLAINSPGEVDIVEAWITFGFFIILLLMAFGVDKISQSNQAKVDELVSQEEQR